MPVAHGHSLYTPPPLLARTWTIDGLEDRSRLEKSSGVSARLEATAGRMGNRLIPFPIGRPEEQIATPRPNEHSVAFMNQVCRLTELFRNGSQRIRHLEDSTPPSWRRHRPSATRRRKGCARRK